MRVVNQPSLVFMVILAALVFASGCTRPGSGVAMELGAAPMVLARDEPGDPPTLHGGSIPPHAEYVLTAVTFYPLANATSGKAATPFRERLRYAGKRWEAVFLEDGTLRRWGGTYSQRDHTLTSVVDFGFRTGVTLVDDFEVTERELRVQFTLPNEPQRQHTFTRLPLKR